MWKIVLVCDRTGVVHDTGIQAAKREAIESAYNWTLANNFDGNTAIAVPDASNITFTAGRRGVRRLGQTILHWIEK